MFFTKRMPLSLVSNLKLILFLVSKSFPKFFPILVFLFPYSAMCSHNPLSAPKFSCLPPYSVVSDNSADNQFTINPQLNLQLQGSVRIPVDAHYVLSLGENVNNNICIGSVLFVQIWGGEVILELLRFFICPYRRTIA